jgi:hypothetical protein
VSKSLTAKQRQVNRPAWYDQVIEESCYTAISRIEDLLDTIENTYRCVISDERTDLPLKKEEMKEMLKAYQRI